MPNSKSLRKASAATQTQAAGDTHREAPKLAARAVASGDRGTKPSKLTYALKAYTAERRADGWWICRTPFSSTGERPEWSGPFAEIETACLSIARRLAIEIADRHTRSIEGLKLKPNDRLYGLKLSTRLAAKKSASTF